MNMNMNMRMLRKTLIPVSGRALQHSRKQLCGRHFWSSKAHKRLAAETTTTVAKRCKTAYDHKLLSISMAGALAVTLSILTLSSSTCDSSPSFQIKQVYEINELLGEGAFGRVFCATRRKDGLVVALKALPIKLTDKADLDREIKALRHLKHPHICKFYDQHSNEDYYFVVMELIQGGELLEHLIQKGPFSEQDASRFLRQFAHALSYMHSQNFVHADLKPENLMMDSWESDAKVRVVDFGCATRLEEGVEEDRVYGTQGYMAPEGLTLPQPCPTPAMDMFAAGIIMYIILTGSHPFDPSGDAEDKELAARIQACSINPELLDRYVWDPDRLQGLSEASIDLLKKLLHPDPNKRISSRIFFQNPWIQSHTAVSNILPQSDLKLQFFWQKRFHNAIRKKFGSSLTEEKLRKIFENMDLDGNGEITLEELQTALAEELGGSKNVPRVLQSLDLDQSGTISFPEFQTIMQISSLSEPENNNKEITDRVRTKLLEELLGKSVFSSKTVFSEEDLRHVFTTMDLDGDGTLCVTEIQQALKGILGLDDEVIHAWVSSNSVVRFSFVIIKKCFF